MGHPVYTRKSLSVKKEELSAILLSLPIRKEGMYCKIKFCTIFATYATVRKAVCWAASPC